VILAAGYDNGHLTPRGRLMQAPTEMDILGVRWERVDCLDPPTDDTPARKIFGRQPKRLRGLLPTCSRPTLLQAKPGLSN
jgi:hypothetical protein